MGHYLQCPLGARPSGWRRFCAPWFSGICWLNAHITVFIFFVPLGTNLFVYQEWVIMWVIRTDYFAVECDHARPFCCL